MNATAKHVLVGLFLACFAGVLVAFNASKPRILVMHASSEKSRWVERADVLLVLSSAGLARNAGSRETTTGPEVAAWVEEHASALPVGVHAGFVADGGGLAISPAGADYGSRGMAMALEWLDDLDGPPPPPMTSAHFDVPP